MVCSVLDTDVDENTTKSSKPGIIIPIFYYILLCI